MNKQEKQYKIIRRFPKPGQLIQWFTGKIYKKGEKIEPAF
jgi:hypothetical protein